MRRSVRCCALFSLLLVPTRAAAAAEATRFSEIGHPTPDDVEDAPEAPPPSVGASVSHTGRVTWTGLRVDLPVSPRWSLVPQAALLHVSPFQSGDSSVVHTYVGGGVAYRPSSTWELSVDALYGPAAHGLDSYGGELSLSKALGGDAAHDVPPVAEVEAALGATHYHWSDGNGPAGADVVQIHTDLRLLFHVRDRLTLSPHLMFFLYDKALDQGGDERVGSVGALALVGSYAPRALYGLRVALRLGAMLEPFVEGAHIVYAAGIGRGTELVAGLQIIAAGRAKLTLGGGFLTNTVSGPLIDPDDDTRTLPVVQAAIELSF